MTTPIQEPSTDRTLSGLSWATRQLARRPAPVGAAIELPWIRLKQIAINQTISASDCATIIYDDVCNPYPDTFSEYIETPEIWGVNTLEPGLYQATVRVSVDGFNIPASGFSLDFYNVDWDLAYPYSTFVPGGADCPATQGIPFNRTLAGYAEVTFRADSEDAFTDPWQLNVKLCTCDDAITIANAYLEVRKLGAAFVPGGLDNFNIECSVT